MSEKPSFESYEAVVSKMICHNQQMAKGHMLHNYVRKQNPVELPSQYRIRYSCLPLASLVRRYAHLGQVKRLYCIKEAFATCKH